MAADVPAQVKIKILQSAMRQAGQLKRQEESIPLLLKDTEAKTANSEQTETLESAIDELPDEDFFNQKTRSMVKPITDHTAKPKTNLIALPDAKTFKNALDTERKAITAQTSAIT
jgi:hypothetical protein